MNQTTTTAIELASQLGATDGTTVANENREQGCWKPGYSADWDAGLINAIGNRKARELFGLTGDASPADDAEYAAALAAYSEAAIKAYDAAE